MKVRDVINSPTVIAKINRSYKLGLSVAEGSLIATYGQYEIEVFDRYDTGECVCQITRRIEHCPPIRRDFKDHNVEILLQKVSNYMPKADKEFDVYIEKVQQMEDAAKRHKGEV